MFQLDDNLYQGPWDGICPDEVNALVFADGRCEFEARDVPFSYQPLPLDATLDELVTAVSSLLALTENGRTVYVSCLYGSGPSILLSAAYLVRKYGLPADGAMAFVSEKTGCRLCEDYVFLLREYEKTFSYNHYSRSSRREALAV